MSRVASMQAVSVVSDGVALCGDAWTPTGDAVAGVVMVGGSGPSDRTNGGYFESYRAAFADHDLAGLWYDKRGVAASTGDYLAGTIDDLATDALAAVTHLRQLVGPEVPVGLFGHSEGGWVALRAAARSSALAFVATNSCPGMTPAVQDRHAVALATRADKVPGPARLAALSLYDELIVAAAADRAFDAVALTIAGSPGRAVLENYVGPFDPRTWTFWKRTRDHDPLSDHRAMSCPHLAIYGAADQLVPVPDSVAAFTSSACDPARDSAASLTVLVSPGADHRVLRFGKTRPEDDHLRVVSSWMTATAARVRRARDGRR